MKVKDFMKFLSRQDLDKELLVSSDEELNTMFKSWQIARLEGTEQFVIYGLSGSEVGE